MTVYALGNEGSGQGTGNVGAAFGAPVLATGRQHRSPVWVPSSRRLLAEPDTLFLLDVADEADVLAQGGRLGSYGTYLADSITTALTGTNNDLMFTLTDPEALGVAAVTIAYVVAGTSTPLSVSVTGRAVTVNVATNGGGAATSTAAQVRDAVNADVGAAALVRASSGEALATGVVTALAATTIGVSKVALTDGPAGKTIGPTVGTLDRLIFPLDGLLPLDQFTLEFEVTSVGMDLTAQPSNCTYFNAALDAAGGTSLGVANEGATQMRAVVRVAGSNYFANTLSTLAVGDVPADTPTKLTLTYDGTNLVLRLRDAVRTSTNNTHGANAAPAMTTIPWGSGDHSGGGLVICGGPSTAPSGAIRIGQFRISRWCRTPGAALLYKGPTITVDAGTTQGAFPSPVSGVFGQYAGWRDGNVADGSAGGGGLTATSIRDQLMAAQGAAGLETVRIDHVFDRIPAITGTFPNYTYDWSHVTEPMDQMVASNPDVGFHITLGYTPSILGATRATAPTDSAAFAQMCSDFLTHAIVTKGYTIRAISLWNEPEGATFWAGNTTQYTTLWGVVQAKLATDHPSLPLGGPDSGAAGSGLAYQQAVMTYAEANARPLAALHMHEYSGDLAQMRSEIRALKAYAATKGFSSIPVRITEWSGSLGSMGALESPATTGSLVHRQPNGVTRSVKHAAFVFAAMIDMLAEGVDLAIHTRMGILDTFYTGVEQQLGLFTHDDPPRPLPAYGAFQAMWAHGGDRIAATSNWPGLRAIASKTSGGIVSLAYGFYRPWRDTDRVEVDFEWTGLPATFTWAHYQIDGTNADEGKLKLVGSGDESNVPLGASVGVMSVGLIQITP